MTATEYKAGTNLEKILSEGKFAVTGECGPPKSADGSVIENKAKMLAGYVDAVNITDNQTAVVRISSIASGYTAMQNGVEPIVQMTCRDRNRLAMQADLLGAHTLGIHNCLCLTGDHLSFGNHPEARGVHDLDAINLIEMLRRMRDEKKFDCGEEMDVAPKFYIGCAENPFGDPFEFRAIRLKKKILAGADFMQTQCIFNIPKFKTWMEEVRAEGLHQEIKILAGITPLKGVGGARYMKNFVPGMDVPDEIVDRMAGVEKGPASHAEGKKLAVEMIKELAEIEGVAGVHIMAVEWEEAVPDIVEAAGLLPRPTVA
ncbi:MAG TPA: methylenetetrahydrofolate reductase [Thermoleophilia bacterium]|jgi:methylenetetrahydrofolate reductase (NADPH)|nr:methylenetetrahydrofolate reductase [Acidobacteriota bacterium]NLT91773.1 methylenetetrahydrofolate reductase [Actinomycetota bacterium]OPZ45532.1 MAG: Bifunctional homocysteine S-methyltransferase/5,10-methylenetetrahydrofolate reductase [Actinobacteria bacterium ADurb.BinA094]HOU29034.1 methylenetetrahydrofolate reductase [Thermoleophilia bacterium]HQF52235.1 methylenetetrahydrofolate reductase [Thermoleophilia bacterium]